MAPKKLSINDYVSSGCSLLNLAITGDVRYGYKKGWYYFFVGESMSGKTWFSVSGFAEAARRKAFKKHVLIHDDVERGRTMDVEYYFGSKTEQRLKDPPNGISTTVEEFYLNINKALDNGPCFYILDSMDSLTCTADIKHAEKLRKAAEAGKSDDAKGSYGTGKAKANSDGLKRLMARLEKTGSILVIIAQTRDNIGFGAQFNPKTRSGGTSLRFYSHCEIWTKVVGALKKTVRGKARQIGAITECRIKKDRNNGQLHSIKVPFYNSMGIDDLEGCIDYLIEEKHWKCVKGRITADDMDFKGTKAKLIKHVEANDLEGVIHELVSETWNDVLEASRVKGRKRRYE